MGIDFNLYFNIFFAFVFFGAILNGYWKGFSKTLFSLFAKVLFFVFFFLSLDFVISFLWDFPLFFLPDTLNRIGFEYDNVETFSSLSLALLQTFLGDRFPSLMHNANFLGVFESFSLFFLKVIYAFFYFTFLSVFYKILTFFLSKIVVRTKGEKKVLGAFMGSLSGAFSIFVSLIMIGGFVDISSNLTEMLSDDEILIYSENNVISLSASGMNVDDFNNLEEIKKFIDAYNNNIFVSFLTSFNHEDSNSSYNEPYNIYFFDRIFSMEYNGDAIEFRKEISIFSDIGSFFYAGEGEAIKINELNLDRLKSSIIFLSESRLIILMTPILIEIFSEELEMDLDGIDFYNWDWENEIREMAIVSTGMLELLIENNFFEESGELLDEPLDGQKIKEVFISASNMSFLTNNEILKEIFSYFEYDFLLETFSEESIDLQEEWLSVGEILFSISNTGISARDLQNIDFYVLIDQMKGFDFEILLDSRLTEKLVVNLVSSLDAQENGFLYIPDDIVWEDEKNNIGELRRLLRGINEIFLIFDDLNLNDFDVSNLSGIDETVIEILLDSKILEVSIGNVLYKNISELDFLVLPEKVISSSLVKDEEKKYINKNETSKLLVVLKELNFVDFENFTDDLEMFSQVGDLENVLDSSIVLATSSKMFLDLEENHSHINIPNFNYEGGVISYYDKDTFFIEKNEILLFFEAISEAGVSYEDFSTNMFSFETWTKNIEPLLNSSILHFIISHHFVNDDFILIPNEDEKGNPILINTPDPEQNYIVKIELEKIFNSLKEIGKESFLDLSLEIEDFLYEVDYDIFLKSVSIRSTISDLILEKALDENLLPSPSLELVVLNEHRILLNKADGIFYTIEENELHNLMRGLSLIGIDDSLMIASSYNAFTQDDLDILLESISLHFTIDNQIKQNENLLIPNMAYYENNHYSFSNIITSQEIKKFILAFSSLSNVLGEEVDYRFDSFSLSQIHGADTEERDVILESKIVRNSLTEQIYVFLIENSIDPENYFEDTDYENDDKGNFLTKESIESFLVVFSGDF